MNIITIIDAVVTRGENEDKILVEYKNNDLPVTYIIADTEIKKEINKMSQGTILSFVNGSLDVEENNDIDILKLYILTYEVSDEIFNGNLKD